jgi:hypothetical protein
MHHAFLTLQQDGDEQSLQCSICFQFREGYQELNKRMGGLSIIQEIKILSTTSYKTNHGHLIHNQSLYKLTYQALNFSGDYYELTLSYAAPKNPPNVGHCSFSEYKIKSQIEVCVICLKFVTQLYSFEGLFFRAVLVVPVKGQGKVTVMKTYR